MKSARLCLILLCAALLLPACGTAAPKTPATDEAEEIRTDATTVTTEPEGKTEEPVAVQALVLSLPATNLVEIDNKKRKIEIFEADEKNGVPMNALRILSPEGEELWRATYAADGTVQCGIVTANNENGNSGFIYWSVRTVPNESITATYMTYAQTENGKYGRLDQILSSQGIPSLQLAGLGGGKSIDVSTASAYHAGKQDFLDFLGSLTSKLMEGTVLFDTDGNRMQWGKWFTHEFPYTNPATGAPDRFMLVGNHG